MKTLRPGMDTPWVIAHRGASADHPENTHDAFEAAANLPIDGMELDLQLTRDRVPVVFHDRTLKKLGHPYRRVAGKTLAEITRLDPGAPHGRPGLVIPTLDEVLNDYAHRVPLLLEIKLRGGLRHFSRHRHLAEMVIQRVREEGLIDRVMLLSFGLHLLEASLEACGPDAARFRHVLNLHGRVRFTKRFARQVAPLFALCHKWSDLTPEFVANAHALGKPVLTYTVNDEKALERVRLAGVDGIISDRPGWLLERIRTG